MAGSYSYSESCRTGGRYEASVLFSPLDMALVYEFFLLPDYSRHGIHILQHYILDRSICPILVLAPPGEG